MGKIQFILVLMLSALSAVASDISVTASVDRNQMRPGDTFTYSVVVSAQGSVSFDQPRLPDLSGFEMISTWSGSEMRGTFVNGQVQTQRSQTFNYMLAATQEGEFTIGATEVVVNGQLFRTNPIQIQVASGAPQGPSQPPSGGGGTPPGGGGFSQDPDDFEDDIFSQLLRRRMNPGLRGIQPGNMKDAFFIHIEVDKRKVYQGEPVVASWYLVTRGQIADIDTLKYPTLSGFWKEDIEVATRLNYQPEIINGIAYQKALLASYALFPIKPGKAVIDAYRAKCRVISHNLMGLPQQAVLTKESPEIEVEVLPLPQEGQGTAFTGGVGDFSVSARTDVTSVKVRQPITYRVRVEGKGNAKVVDMPKLSLPESVQVYDTKSEMKFFPNGRSYKEFETLLLPKTPGNLVIPAMVFSFFNPVSKSYYQKSTSEILIHVEPGAEGADVIPSAPLQATEKQKVEIEAVRPGFLLMAEENPKLSTAQQVGVWGGIYGLTALGLLFFAYREMGRKEKKEDLRRQIQRRIGSIKNDLEKGDWRRVGAESINLIYSILGEISEQGGATFEMAKLIEKSPPSFRRELAPRIQSLMSQLEVVGFAPESVVGKWRDKKELKSLLAETEKCLLQAARYDFSQAESATTEEG